MKIGVISDSHDNLPALRKALAHFVDIKVDAIIHAGDLVAPFAAELLKPPTVPESISVYCIYGNNDGERAGLAKVLPQITDGPLRLTLGGKTIVVHHFEDWLKPADITNADIVITGHTHQPVNETRDDILFLNPGECCGWINNRCTVALLDTDGPNAQIIEITPAPAPAPGSPPEAG